MPKTTVTEDNVERLFVDVQHMEPFTEVMLHDKYPEQPRVAGTIVRAEETGSADLSSMRAKIFESEEPVFHGRVALPEVSMRLIKQWMQSCSVQHDPCRLPALATAKEQLIRSIDVQDHRIIPSTSAEKYVALSYVWGPTMTPAFTRDTISNLSSIGVLKDLIIPRTIMDAMQLVKCIGMRYLWVDSFFIVQGDDNDKQHQLTIMDSIYINTELLVMAACDLEQVATVA